MYFNFTKFLLGVFCMPFIKPVVKKKNKLWFKGLINKWEQKHHITIMLECEKIPLYYKNKVQYFGEVAVKWRAYVKLGKCNKEDSIWIGL